MSEARVGMAGGGLAASPTPGRETPVGSQHREVKNAEHCAYPTSFTMDGLCFMCTLPFLKHMLWSFIFLPFLLSRFVLKLH